METPNVEKLLARLCRMRAGLKLFGTIEAGALTAELRELVAAPQSPPVAGRNLRRIYAETLPQCMDRIAAERASLGDPI